MNRYHKIMEGNNRVGVVVATGDGCGVLLVEGAYLVKMGSIESLVHRAMVLADEDKNARVGFFGNWPDYREFISPLNGAYSSQSRKYSSNSGASVQFFHSDTDYSFISGNIFTHVFLLDSVKHDPMHALARLRSVHNHKVASSVFLEDVQ